MEKVPQLFNREKYEDYAQRMRDLYAQVDKTKFTDLHNNVTDFSSEIMSRHGDIVRQLALFHALAFSTIGEDMVITGDDLSGEDSIAKFIDDLYDRYKQYLPKE